MVGGGGIMARCPFCDETKIDPVKHYPTPPGEGCPSTPMTRSATPPAPSRRRGEPEAGPKLAIGSGIARTTEGRSPADPVISSDVTQYTEVTQDQKKTREAPRLDIWGFSFRTNRLSA